MFTDIVGLKFNLYSLLFNIYLADIFSNKKCTYLSHSDRPLIMCIPAKVYFNASRVMPAQNKKEAGPIKRIEARTIESEEKFIINRRLDRLGCRAGVLLMFSS